MFGIIPSIGIPELILILVLALIIFGPKKLPEIGRSIGQSIKEFKRATTTVSKEFEEALNENETPQGVKK